MDGQPVGVQAFSRSEYQAAYYRQRAEELRANRKRRYLLNTERECAMSRARYLLNKK